MSRYKQMGHYITSQFVMGDYTPFKRYVIRRIKHKSKHNNIPFNLTIDDIIIPEYCPIFGIKLKLGFNSGAGGNSDSISIDRIDPNKGYIKDNILIISHKANTLKNNATLEELKKVLEYARNHTL